MPMDHILGLKLLRPGNAPGRYVDDVAGLFYHGGWQDYPQKDAGFLVPVLGGLLAVPRAGISKLELVALACDEDMGGGPGDGRARFRRVRVRSTIPWDEVAARPVLAGEVLQWAAAVDNEPVARHVTHTAPRDAIETALSMASRFGSWSVACALSDLTSDTTARRMPVELDRDALRRVRSVLKRGGRTFQDYAVHAVHSWALDEAVVAAKEMKRWEVTGKRTRTSLTVRLPFDQWVEVLEWLREFHKRTGERSSVRAFVHRAVVLGP